MTFTPSKILTIKTGWFSKTSIDTEHWEKVFEGGGSCSYTAIPVTFRNKKTGEIVKGTAHGYDLTGKRYRDL